MTAAVLETSPAVDFDALQAAVDEARLNADPDALLRAERDLYLALLERSDDRQRNWWSWAESDVLDRLIARALGRGEPS